MKYLALINMKLGNVEIETPSKLPRSLILGCVWLKRMKGVINCSNSNQLEIEHLGLKTKVK